MRCSLSHFPSLATLAVATCPGLLWAQAGLPDPTFGNQGVVRSDLDGAGSPSLAFAAARHPLTGRFVVASGVTGNEGHEQWTVYAFRADGTRDDAFGQHGVVRTDFEAVGNNPDHPAAIAFDTSGNSAQHRILVAGHATIADPTTPFVSVERLAVAAYLPNGALDVTFAGDGIFLFGGQTSTRAIAIATRPDGSMIVAGTQDGGALVLRLGHDGTLDPTFGSGGTTSVSMGDAGLVAATVQPDGGVVLGGHRFTFDPVFAVTSELRRVSPTGTPDAGFGSAGVASLPDQLLATLKSRSDGGLVALTGSPTFGDPSRVWVIPASGSVVGSGLALQNGFEPASLEVADDDSIVVGGAVSSDSASFAVARLGADASADAAFDVDGYAVRDLGGHESGAHGMPLPSGGVAIAGQRRDPTTFAASFVVAQLQPGGAADTAFALGAGYSAFPTTASAMDFGQDIAVHQADGKLVVLARSFPDGNAVLRYLADGTLDPAFGTGGVRLLDEPALQGWNAQGIGLQSNGRVIVSGLRFTFLSGPPWSQYDLVAVALGNTGDLDATFGNGGITAASLAGTQFAQGGGIALQADDKILACTTTTVTFGASTMAIVRLQANGALDTSFGIGGHASVGVANASASATSIAVASDGRIAVAGTIEMPFPDNQMRIALAWLDGGGVLLHGPATTVPGFGVDVAVDGSGRALVAAQRFWGTTVYDEQWNVIGVQGASPWTQGQMAVLRVLPTGALDAAFGGAGVAALTVPAADNAYCTTVVAQPDSKVVLAGAATIQTSPTAWANDLLVARLLPNGLPDASFADDGVTNIDVGAFDTAQSVLLQGDGMVVVVGTVQSGGFSFFQKSDVVVARLLGVTNPHAMVEALQEVVRMMAQFQVLNQGRARGLAAKLQAALNQIDQGNVVAAGNQMSAFRNQVLAFQSAGQLGSADATVLIAAANGILAMLLP